MTSAEVSIRFFERHLKEDILKYGERQAIHMAISALREQPRWISVEERLPEAGGNYLCYCPVLQICGKDIPNYEVYRFTLDAEEIYDLKMTGHKGAAWCWYDSEYGWCSTGSVTHWMPLPEPPEEEV